MQAWWSQSPSLSHQSIPLQVDARKKQNNILLPKIVVRSSLLISSFFKLKQPLSPQYSRLDWLMWFAAFQHPYQNEWLIRFAIKLFENDQEVSTLIESNPFINGMTGSFQTFEFISQSICVSRKKKVQSNLTLTDFKGQFLSDINKIWYRQ